MNDICSCRFCDIKNGIYTYQDIDKPFFNSEEYYSIASIGAIIIGWGLIIPKKHCFSMKEHYKKAAFRSAINELLNRYLAIYDTVALFEHGANAQGSLTSCGTSHAHLHIVPNISIVKEIINTELEWNKCCADAIHLVEDKHEYLYYSEIQKGGTWGGQLGFCHILKEPCSQFFRKIISTKYGTKSKYDYKSHQYIKNSRRTREIFEESYSLGSAL